MRGPKPRGFEFWDELMQQTIVEKLKRAMDTWLTWDKRLFSAMIIAPQDPVAAAAEIRRLGSHPRIIEVLMCSATRVPLGQIFPKITRGRLSAWYAKAVLRNFQI